MTHDVAIHGIERLHDFSLGESSLNPFAERISVAKPQDHRSFLILLKWIGNVDEDFVTERFSSHGLQRRHGMHSAGAANHDFTEGSRVLKSCGVSAFA
jgi:hypothetical protein